VLSPYASSAPALIGAKIGTTSSAIWKLDKLHKAHPRGATIALIAINVGYAFVVVHNYSIPTGTHPSR